MITHWTNHDVAYNINSLFAPVKHDIRVILFFQQSDPHLMTRIISYVYQWKHCAWISIQRNVITQHYVNMKQDIAHMLTWAASGYLNWQIVKFYM